MADDWEYTINGSMWSIIWCTKVTKLSAKKEQYIFFMWFQQHTNTSLLYSSTHTHRPTSLACELSNWCSIYLWPPISGYGPKCGHELGDFSYSDCLIWKVFRTLKRCKYPVPDKKKVWEKSEKLSRFFFLFLCPFQILWPPDSQVGILKLIPQYNK